MAVELDAYSEIAQGIAVETKKALDQDHTQFQVRKPEDDPAQHHHKQQICIGKQGQFFQNTLQEQTLDHQEDEEPQAPQHKVPAGAVPQTGQCPDNKGVEHTAQKTAAAAAQGNIYIIPEEGAKAHVPASPEIGDGPGNVGIVEVFQIMQAQHFAHADGHVGICGEIQVNVQGISCKTQPGTGHGKIGQQFCIGRKLGGIGNGGVCEDQGIGQGTTGVGKECLLGKAHAEPGNTPGHFRLSGLTAEQLLVNGLIADDGAGYALVEQRCVKQHIPVTLLGAGILTVHIHNISQKLEGVERDTNGQCDAPDEIRNGAKDGAEESCVFEVANESDVNNGGNGHPDSLQPSFFRVGNAQGAEPGHESHEHQKQHIFRFSPGVEDQGEDQQHDVLCPLGAAEGVSQQRQREKCVQKNQT